MGFVYVNVALSNPASPDTAEEIRVLVDTGATLSVFPASLLDKMRVERIGRRRFRGFGGVVTRDVGTVNMRYGDATVGVTAVFGDEGAPAIMGVTALETLGYNVNPVDGELYSVDMLI